MTLRIVVLGCSALLLQCSSLPKQTIENRDRPLKILSCQELFAQTELRDNFFSAFRGRVFVKTKDLSTDVDLVLWHPHYLRMEVVGAMGVKVALFIMNKEWVQLYLIKEKVLYRLPKQEFLKNGVRRQAFLRLLPFEWMPELVPGILSTHIDLKTPNDAQHGCHYSESDNAYIVRVAGSKMGRLIWLDPTSLGPLKQWVFQGEVPRPDKLDLESSKNATWIVQFASPKGSSLSTLRREISFIKGANLEPVLTLYWQSAESWSNPSEKIFEWNAPESISVKEY